MFRVNTGLITDKWLRTNISIAHQKFCPSFKHRFSQTKTVFICVLFNQCPKLSKETNCLIFLSLFFFFCYSFSLFSMQSMHPIFLYLKVWVGVYTLLLFVCHCDCAACVTGCVNTTSSCLVPACILLLRRMTKMTFGSVCIVST